MKCVECKKEVYGKMFPLIIHEKVKWLPVGLTGHISLETLLALRFYKDRVCLDCLRALIQFIVDRGDELEETEQSMSE